MRVLITGATGFLGAQLCRRFLAEGCEVTAFHRPSSDLTRLAGLAVAHAAGDVTDADAVRRAVAGHDVVLHAAANLTYWRQVRAAQARVNVAGTRHVAAACLAAGVRRLVHVSSVAAIGIPTNPRRPANEAFPFNLDGSGLYYHQSKRRAEDEIAAAARRGLDAVVVNPGTIFGPDGVSYRGGGMLAKVGRRPVVPYFTGGINVVQVDDVVDGIGRALERGAAGERYILGGENVSYRRIAALSLKHQGLRRTFVPVPSLVTWAAATLLAPVGARTGRRPAITYETHYCASRWQFYTSAKAERALGYTARPFEAIVRAYFKQRQQHATPVA